MNNRQIGTFRKFLITEGKNYCSNCNEIKLIEEFGINRSVCTGLDRICKKCGVQLNARYQVLPIKDSYIRKNLKSNNGINCETTPQEYIILNRMIIQLKREPKQNQNEKIERKESKRSVDPKYWTAEMRRKYNVGPASMSCDHPKPAKQAGKPPQSKPGYKKLQHIAKRRGG